MKSYLLEKLNVTSYCSIIIIAITSRIANDYTAYRSVGHTVVGNVHYRITV